VGEVTNIRRLDPNTRTAHKAARWQSGKIKVDSLFPNVYAIYEQVV
jgi:hypothetical protein